MNYQSFSGAFSVVNQLVEDFLANEQTYLEPKYSEAQARLDFIDKFSIFIHAENITDVHQSNFGQVVFPPHQSPTFAEIYTHTEGRIFNGGVKIRF